MQTPEPRSRDRGFTTLELLTVIALAAIVLLVTLPAMKRFYLQHRIDAASEVVRTLVQQARINALRERIAYRVLLHDENAATPNTIELQQSQGGTFVTLSGETHTLGEPLRILGSGATNSMNNITVSSRGECSSGNVYVSSYGAEMGVVAIASTCFTNAL